MWYGECNEDADVLTKYTRERCISAGCGCRRLDWNVLQNVAVFEAVYVYSMYGVTMMFSTMPIPLLTKKFALYSANCSSV